MIFQRSLLVAAAYFGLSSFGYAQDLMVTTIGHGHAGVGFYGHLDLQAQGDMHLDGDWFDKRFSESIPTAFRAWLQNESGFSY